MVRKVQKPKSSSLKPSSSAKKGVKKSKDEEKLTNGIGDNEDVKEETKSEVKTVEKETAQSEKRMDTEPESPEDEEAREQEDPAEIKSVKTAPKSRKRKTASKATEKKVATKIKSKNKMGNNEKKETKSEVKTAENEIAESDEKMDTVPELQENEDAEKQENRTEVKSVPKSRKRKAAEEVSEKKTSAKTRSKKQKVFLEITKRNSIPGKVFVIGDNAVGQLGLGEDVTEKKRPTLLDLPHSIVDIAAGGMHSVCLTESGEIITFGCNDEGALGRPTTEEGSEYIPQRVDIPERIVQVSAGDSHSAALSESGQVYIWGNFRNNNGPMGLVTAGANQITPVKILNDITVVKIASGNDHLACLSQEGMVYTCGNGEAGQLGRISEHSSDGGRRGMALLIVPDVVPLGQSNKSCIVDNLWTSSFATFFKVQQSGSIYAFGLNNYNQLGLTNASSKTAIWKPKQVTSFNSRTWTQIDGGDHHTIALDNDGLVYSLGRSEYGRLGLGQDCEQKSEPTLIPSLENDNCINISSGNTCSFAVTDNGSAYSWGMGTNNQLGHGNEDDQHTPRLIEGHFFNSWRAFKIAGGGQHTLILAHPKNSSEKSQ